jgi:hypothetical protein
MTFVAFSIAGDHTRVIQVSAPSVGGLAKFAIRTAVCMGCKTPLGKTGKGSTSTVDRKRVSVADCAMFQQSLPSASIANRE